MAEQEFTAFDDTTFIEETDDLLLQRGVGGKNFKGKVLSKLNSSGAYNFYDLSGNYVGKINTVSAYTGTGTGTGAPRMYLGTKTPVNDDSAICVGRIVDGTGLFSHAFRDESDVKVNGSGAYTAYDARFNIVTNADASKINHSYCFQSSHEMKATNGIDLFAGHVSSLRISNGRADRVFHHHVQGTTFSGTGAASQHVGYYCDILTGGDGTNFAFFAQGNASALIGALQISGALTGVTTLTCSNQVTVGAIQAAGNLESFAASGGVYLVRNIGPSAYGGLQAYTNASGTPSGMCIQGAGGVTIVGGYNPASSAALQVGGDIAPLTDNARDLGTASLRMRVIYAGTGTINTSDEREKSDIGEIPNKWLDAWSEVKWSRFKMKGGKRWHVGLVAQQVHAAFAKHSLDAFDIGLCCFDEWEEMRNPIYETVTRTGFETVPTGDVFKSGKNKGKPRTRKVERTFEEMVDTGKTEVVLEAGNRWGLRYDECQAIEAAWQRREIARLTSRLDALSV